ncbi:hypothetical protein CFC21_108774 [Triticum aestivum]|uniref:Uncharacterized protein n=2 Tax=Triticum aestivum TaxID=4565 RepID=A0A9R1MJM6_WHEAT|nr:hypothetical protein CFC21_108774 [Triticum aestivum]
MIKGQAQSNQCHQELLAVASFAVTAVCRNLLLIWIRGPSKSRYTYLCGEFEIVCLTSSTAWTFYIRPGSELDMRFIQTFENCRRLIKMVFAKKLTGGEHNKKC